MPVNVEDLILVSVDDHVIEPPDMFKRHMPAELAALAPRNEHFPDGSDRWIYEDRVVAQIGLNAVVGRPPEEYGCEPKAYADLRKGTYDLKSRIDDMNARRTRSSPTVSYRPITTGISMSGAAALLGDLSPSLCCRYGTSILL
jgi:hypothetical protein